MRLFFTTDIHGSEKCFRKFLSAAKAYKAEFILIGGDITGKTIIPIVEQTDGTFQTHYLGQNVTIKSKDKLQQLTKEIRFTGSYPYITNPQDMEELNALIG